jgi:hypothetical protein
MPGDYTPPAQANSGALEFAMTRAWKAQFVTALGIEITSFAFQSFIAAFTMKKGFAVELPAL